MIDHLRGRQAFLLLRSEGRTWRTKQFTIVWRPDTVVSLREQPVPLVRVAFATRKKLGNAVMRNKIRRRMTEILREFSPLMNESGMLLISPQTTAMKLNFQQLRVGLLSVLTTAHIIENNGESPK